MFFQPDFMQIGIVVGGGVALYLGEKLLEWALQAARETWAIRFLKQHYSAIDAVLVALPPDISGWMVGNPLAQIVPALLEDAPVQDQVSAKDILDAVEWAGTTFDWNYFEGFDPEDLSPIDRKLAEAATAKIVERLNTVGDA